MRTKENLRKRLVKLHRVLCVYLEFDSQGVVTPERLSSLMVCLFRVYVVLWCRDKCDFLKK